MVGGLDYSLLLSGPGGVAKGVLVEEFVFADDHSALGLRGIVWTAASPRWVGASSFSRALRGSAELLAGVVPTDRAGAADGLAGLGGGRIPDEASLTAAFTDCEAFAVAPVLRLGPAAAPSGFRERRVYRVLFAKEPSGTIDGGRRTVGGDHFSWNLRRVGRNIAWALDLTVLLGSDSDRSVRPVLRELTAAVRKRGLIPVTIERFA